VGARGNDSAYRSAGVDIEAGDRSVGLIRERIAAAGATRPEVLGAIGGFAGGFSAAFDGMRDPVLVSGTDGVGTKVMIAQTLDRHDTIGIDAVAMVVDDIVCEGGRPLFVLDYIACGRLVPERIADIVGGVAEGCRIAGAALLGGETAEHPGAMGEAEYDIATFAVGVVERERMLGPHRVREGDVVVGLASSGLHANGYSLVRKIILDRDLSLGVAVPGCEGTLGEELLRPCRIHAPAVLAAEAAAEVHAAAHITGGGLVDNVARALPDGLGVRLDARAWRRQPIFDFLQAEGGISEGEMRRVFNCGLGMVLVVPEPAAATVVDVLRAHGETASVAGHVVAGEGVVIEG